MPTYSIQADCSNCDVRDQEVSISKGQLVNSAECPNCGCKTIQKKGASLTSNGTTTWSFPNVGGAIGGGSVYLCGTETGITPSTY